MESEQLLRRALVLDPLNPSIYEQLSINYRCQQRYADGRKVLADGLAVAPGSVELLQCRARIDLDERGDALAMQRALADALQQHPDAAASLAQELVESALSARDHTGAAAALRAISPNGISLHRMKYPPAWFEGQVAAAFGEDAAARQAFGVARIAVERMAQEQPDLAVLQSALGMIDARLGRGPEAIRESREALERLPVSRDAIESPELIINDAATLAWSGQTEAAITQLESAARIPSRLSYGLLKTHPRWDPLRGNPRFEALLARMKPATRE